jgi:hypothetical protein
MNLEAAVIDGYQQVPDKQEKVLSARSGKNKVGDVVPNVLRLRR